MEDWLVAPTQFAVVPRRDLDGFDHHRNTFGCLCCDHRARIFVQWSCIAFPDQLAVALHSFAVFVDGRLPFDLYASQFFIAFASLSKTRKSRIAPEIDGFL